MIHRTTFSIAIVAALLTGDTHAATSVDADVSDKPEPVTATPPSTGTAGIKRISPDALKRHVTAKLLIGANVVSSDDKTIGEIVDVSLMRNIDTTEPNIRLGRLDVIEAPEVTGLYATVAATPADDADDASHEPSASVLLDRGRPIVIMAVGGVLGIGESLISIHLESLEYHPKGSRFSLPVTKAEFDAMVDAQAPVAPRPDDSATGIQNSEDRLASADTDVDHEESAARERIDEEIRAIELALANSRVLAPSASGLDVTDEGDAITISGTVDSQMDKERILALAREISSRTIRDQIRVDG